MSKSKQEKSRNEFIEGFNPRVYRRLSILFIILTILNIAMVVFAFSITGYGLWHAEDALSCIAKIDSSFNDINQSLLEIELHTDNQQFISEKVDSILAYRETINENAERFRGIDLSNIDKSLPNDFEASMQLVSYYYGNISDTLNDLKNGTADLPALRNDEFEQLRKNTTASLDALFVKQDEATYIFFCRVAQRFLLVILFLLLTMSMGLFAIYRAKKRDYQFATELQSSKKKTENIRQKAVEIAFTNVVTGLKNRHALAEELDERIDKEEFTVVLFRFTNFNSIYELYGRDYADDFMAVVSKDLVATYGDQAEIFSTETDEFCVVFKKELVRSRTNISAQKILYSLSQPITVQDAKIQLTVAGCSCHCRSNLYPSAAKLFVAMDRSISQTKIQCAEQNRSLLVSLQ